MMIAYTLYKYCLISDFLQINSKLVFEDKWIFDKILFRLRTCYNNNYYRPNYMDIREFFTIHSLTNPLRVSVFLTSVTSHLKVSSRAVFNTIPQCIARSSAPALFSFY